MLASEVRRVATRLEREMNATRTRLGAKKRRRWVALHAAGPAEIHSTGPQDQKLYPPQTLHYFMYPLIRFEIHRPSTDEPPLATGSSDTTPGIDE